MNTLAKEGQKVALQCQIIDGAFPPVSFRWFEDDTEKKEYKNNIIIWLKAKLDFNGVSFKCNDCGEEVKKFQLYVTGTYFD